MNVGFFETNAVLFQREFSEDKSRVVHTNVVGKQRGTPSFEREVCDVCASPYRVDLDWSFFSILPRDVADTLPG